MGITDSDVMVSQGVDEAALEETGATLEGVGITLTVPEAGVELEGRGAGPEGTWTGTEEEEGACSELVATGTTLSEVMVSQGVEEAAPDETGATLEGVGTTGLEAGPEGTWTGTEEDEGTPSELVAMGTTLSEVKVSQGVEEAPGAETEGVPLTGLSPLGVGVAEEAAALDDRGPLLPEEGVPEGEADELEPEMVPMMIEPLRSTPVNHPRRVRRMSEVMSMSTAPAMTAAN